MRRTLRSNSKAAPVNVVVDEEDSSVAVLNMEESHGQSEAAGGGDSLHSLMAGLSGDPSKLCELLVKNLSIANESNQQMQKLLQEHVGGNKTITSFGKLDNCPVKGKYSSLDAWIQEVELWDETNSSSSNIENLSAKKYLKFMESVKNSEDCDEFKS